VPQGAGARNPRSGPLQWSVPGCGLRPYPGYLLADTCTQVGLKVVSIRRLRIGKVSLAKMPVGHWRYLPVGERF